MTLGAPVARHEDLRLLTGRGRFLADHRLEGMLHATFVRADHAHADVLGIDVGAAAAVPGVRAVLVAADLPLATLSNARHPGLVATEQPVLVAERVRFAGEAVAIVVATDRYIAEDAAELVVVDASPRPAVTRADVEPGPAAELFEGIDGNVIYREHRRFGDPDAAFGRAAHVVRRALRFGRQSASPIEGRGCIASFDPFERCLTVWASTQSPHAMRRKLAAVTGLPEHRIVVQFHDIGGAFGQKIPLHPEEAVVSLTAMHLGATVAWFEDRRENLIAAPHAREQHVTLELALDDEGVILAARAEVVGDAGAYSFNAGTALTEPYLTARSMLGPYRIADYAYDVLARVTNKSPVAPYRGVGFVNAQVIRELCIDDAARLLGLDRAELRRRNLISDDEHPYTNAVGMVYDSGSHRACLDDAVALITAARGAREADGDAHGKLLGIGISSFVEPTAPGSALVREVWGTPSREGDLVRVALDVSGTATVSFGTPSLGQGVETTIPQVVAEELGIGVDDVAVVLDNTSVAPVSLTGTRGSRSAVITGGAAASAAVAIVEMVRQVAASVLEAAVDDIEVLDGRAYVRGAPARSLTVGEVVEIGLTSPDGHGGSPPATFSATRTFDPPAATYANGCVATLVEVDEVTGAVELLRMVVAHDCGTVINPTIVDGQIVGAAVQGFGAAILEELHYGDDGQPLTTTFADYHIPTTTDTVPIDLVHHVSPSPHTWRGVKGAGEAGTIGATAAVIGAVADALGDARAAITRVPLRPAIVSDLLAGLVADRTADES